MLENNLPNLNDKSSPKISFFVKHNTTVGHLLIWQIIKHIGYQLVQVSVIGKAKFSLRRFFVLTGVCSYS